MKISSLIDDSEKNLMRSNRSKGIFHFFPFFHSFGTGKNSDFNRFHFSVIDRVNDIESVLRVFDSTRIPSNISGSDRSVQSEKFSDIQHFFSFRIWQQRRQRFRIRTNAPLDEDLQPDKIW
jgi:hypothetical protein